MPGYIDLPVTFLLPVPGRVALVGFQHGYCVWRGVSPFQGDDGQRGRTPGKVPRAIKAQAWD